MNVARLFLGWIVGSVVGTFVFFVPLTWNLFSGTLGDDAADFYSWVRIAAFYAQAIFVLLVPSVMATAWISRRTALAHRAPEWLVVVIGAATFGLIGLLSSKFFPTPELSFRYVHFVTVGAISSVSMWRVATKPIRTVEHVGDGKPDPVSS